MPSCYIFFIVLLGLFCTLTYGSTKRMICQEISDLSDGNEGCVSRDSYQQGLPGKRGPEGPAGQKGQSGAKGQKGDEGTIDYDRITGQVIKGVTLVGHDAEGDFFVDGFEAPGSYFKDITYAITVHELRRFIADSKFCRQYMKYQCHGSILFANHNKSPDRRGWWLSGTQQRVNKWAGAKHDYTCPCADAGTCVSGWKCNCDRNDAVWRSDEGYVTDKDLLPVTQLRFGDTGDSGEMGFHTLGKLECYA